MRGTMAFRRRVEDERMSSSTGRFRRDIWRLRNLPLIGAALLALAIVAPVAAAEFLRDSEPRVAQDETITDDLYVMGGDTEIAGRITRDALVATGRFTLASTGRIDGNLNLAAGQVNLDGNVGRSARIAAGDVEIRGSIGGDLVVTAGQVKIERGAAILGDVVLAGGDVIIRGDVGGEVRGSTGDLEIDGNVAGDVDVSVSGIALGPQARVTGGVEYDSDNDIALDDASNVTGAIVQQEPNPMVPGASSMTWLTTKMFRLLCALVAGLVIVLVLPRSAVSIANAARYSPLGSFVRGLILLFAVPLAAVILAITIVGIPIALIVLVAYVVTLYLSQVFVGLALGRFILPDRWGDIGRGYNLLAMTIGVIILFAPRFIPVPFLDTAISVVYALVGLGAAMVGVTMRRYSPSYGTV